MADSRTKPSVTDLAGDLVNLSVTAGKYTIKTVTWSLGTNNVYQNQILNYRTGFDNLPYTSPQNSLTNSFCWGPNSGSYTITANVTYVNPNITGTQASVYVSLVRPTGNVTISSVGTPSLTQAGGEVTLLSADEGSHTNPYGIDYLARISLPVLASGIKVEFGVIQTLNVHASYQYTSLGTRYTDSASVSNPPGGPKTEPRPIVDDASAGPVFKGTFYGSMRTGSGNSSGSLSLSDTPGMPPLPNSYDNESLISNFTVTLMYSPFPQGIWVPLGYFTWTVNMAATNNGGSPAKWGITYTPTSTTAYTTSTAYPAWTESNYYLWDNYGPFVQTAP